MLKNRTKGRGRRPGAFGLCVLALGTSCGGSDDDRGGPPPDNLFSTFVLEQFAATADDTEPEPINAVEFVFDESPGAFNSLLED